MSKKRPQGLGRGLETLLNEAKRSNISGNVSNNSGGNVNISGGVNSNLGGNVNNNSNSNVNKNVNINPSSTTSSSLPLTGLFEMALKYLQPGQYQPRQKIETEELIALSDSIRSQGIIQPLVVRKIAKDVYEIIAGERRFQAAKHLGLEKVPVIIKEVSDQQALCMALIENIQRENLNPLEEALSLERLSKEFFLTHTQIAEMIGKSRATVSNLLRILSLPEEVKNLLRDRSLDLGHAKVLLGLKSDQLLQMAKRIVAKGLSVRETERLINEKPEQPRKPKAFVDPDVQRLENNLRDKLGAIVHIVQANAARGKLVIEYNSLEELEGILEHLL